MRKPRGYSPAKDSWHNLQIASYGTKFSWELWKFGIEWRGAVATMNPDGTISKEQFKKDQELLRALTGKRSPVKPADWKRRYAGLVRQTHEHIKAAIAKGNGDFFRAFADWIEAGEQQTDKLRRFLIWLQFDSNPPFAQNKFYTCREMQNIIARNNLGQIDNRQLLTINKELGARFKKAKEGRPKKLG